MKRITFSFILLILTLHFASSAQSSSFDELIIDGVKFLDKVPEVEWYKVDGESLIIGWRGIPKFFPHMNRKAAVRGSIATGHKVHVWAVRHTQKNWNVGSGKSYICFLTAMNGRIKNDTCRH